MAGSFAPPTDGTTVINNVLTQEANRITQDIHRETLHVSPWIDLVKKSNFPDGMGYQLNTLIYDRSLPQNDSVTPGTFDQLGANWKTLRSSALVASNADIDKGLIEGASQDVRGPQDGVSRVDFTRLMKQFSLARSIIHSPRLNLEDLRFAAHRSEQLRAIMDVLKDSVRRTWEDRHRDEYDRIVKNFVSADGVSSSFSTQVAVGDITADEEFEGQSIEGIRILNSGSGNSDITPDANISNALLDKIYFRLVRAGGGMDAYGRENARPVQGLVLSSEASRALQIEDKYREDIRESSRANELIAALGVEKSFRGFYHLIDDLAPRFSIDGDGDLVRVYPETVDGSGRLVPNAAYESASYEAAYVLHPQVMETLVPTPSVSSPGLQLSAMNYRGEYKWTNIPNETTNPDGTIGFFRGILASATKPLKTSFGYAILFKRDSSTYAA